MYFQNYFANKSMKLKSCTSHLQHSRPCCMRYTTLAFVIIHIKAFASFLHIPDGISLIIHNSGEVTSAKISWESGKISKIFKSLYYTF